MAKHYNNYNASYPLAYYSIGTIYSFYGVPNSNAKPATDEQIKEFAKVLDELEKSEQNSSPNAITPVEKSETATNSSNSGIHRYYAVVVEKKKTSIVVMFHNTANGQVGYLTKQYIVSGHCDTDGKNLMPTQNGTSYGTAGTPQKKIGGITRVDQKEHGKVGGITRVGTRDASKSGVGGITRVHQNESPSNPANGRVGGITRVHQTENSSSPANGRVGGITRVHQTENSSSPANGRVGGITRVKK